MFAANLPLARIELDSYTKLPRRDALIVTLDDGEGLAELAAARLIALGYTNVRLFDRGLTGWIEAGGEVFIDVNVPSKAFLPLRLFHLIVPAQTTPELGLDLGEL